MQKTFFLKKDPHKNKIVTSHTIKQKIGYYSHHKIKLFFRMTSFIWKHKMDKNTVLNTLFLKRKDNKIILPSRGWNKTCWGKPNFLQMDHHQPCCHPDFPSPCSHPNVAITTLPSPSSQCCCHNAAVPMLLSQHSRPNVAIPMFPSSYCLPDVAIRHIYTALPFPMLHNAALPM